MDRKCIKELAELLRTQDNRCTHLPVFMVQREELVFGLDPEYCETIGWIHVDSRHPIEGDEAEELEQEYEATGDEPADYYRSGYKYEWRNVQPFLTEKGAENYIKINGHNLGKTRIYVESGYRNSEWELLRNLVLELGEQFEKEEQA